MTTFYHNLKKYFPGPSGWEMKTCFFTVAANNFLVFGKKRGTVGRRGCHGLTYHYQNKTKLTNRGKCVQSFESPKPHNEGYLWTLLAILTEVPPPPPPRLFPHTFPWPSLKPCNIIVSTVT
jgi:hypothetical protein